MSGNDAAGLGGGSRVLRAVHARGSISRSTICSLTGLNRSTVASLVSTFADAGVVEEASGNSGSVGRPSLTVRAIPDSLAAIGWDIRVDRSTAIVMGLGGEVLQRWEKLHRRGSTDIYEVAARVATGTSEMMEALPDHVRWVGMGLAMPGIIDPVSQPPRTVVHRSPTLGWLDIPFAEVVRAGLGERFGADFPILLGNDANLGAMAEWTRGAGRDSRAMLFISGDLGIGGGVVVNGELLTGAAGFAGEIGHIRFASDGPACRCGAKGCWETAIGAETIVRSAGLDPMFSTADEVLASARSGDVGAQQACSAAAQALGEGLASVINVINPDTVVLAGHLAGLLEEYRHTIIAGLEHTLARQSLDVKLVPPLLGSESIVVGAAELGFEPALAKPQRFLGETPSVRID